MTRIELAVFVPVMIVRHLIEWSAIRLGLGRFLEARLRRRLRMSTLRFARLERLWVYEKLQDIAEKTGNWSAVERLVEEQAADPALADWTASAFLSAAERAFDADRFGPAAEYLRRATQEPVKQTMNRDFLGKRAVELRARLNARAATNV
jgi:uncharacterized protein HemY